MLKLTLLTLVYLSGIYTGLFISLTEQTPEPRCANDSDWQEHEHTNKETTQ